MSDYSSITESLQRCDIC